MIFDSALEGVSKRGVETLESGDPFVCWHNSPFSLPLSFYVRRKISFRDPKSALYSTSITGSQQYLKTSTVCTGRD